MKLHWTLSNPIVLVMILSMLSMTPALAKFHQPQECWTCCPNGPLCDDGNDNLNYRVVVGHTTGYTNTQVGGTALAAWQWYDVAVRISRWQAEADKNGTMAKINSFYVRYRVDLEAPTLDMTKLVPALQSLGYKGDWTQLAWSMNTLTQAQRIGMTEFVIKYGYDPVAAYVTQQALAMYHSLLRREPVRMPCSFFNGAAVWFTFAAMGSALIGQEELVVPLGFIGATFAVAGYMGGC